MNRISRTPLATRGNQRRILREAREFVDARIGVVTWPSCGPAFLPAPMGPHRFVDTSERVVIGCAVTRDIVTVRRVLLCAATAVLCGATFTAAQTNADAGLPWEAAKVAILKKFDGVPHSAQQIEPFKVALQRTAPASERTSLLRRLILHHLFPYSGRVKLALMPARPSSWRNEQCCTEMRGAPPSPRVRSWPR